MSKKSRAKAQERRRKEKTARKMQKISLYESYMRAGTNSKRRRRQAKKANKRQWGVSHPLGRCGNAGCIRCQGINYKPFLKKGIPVGMPQWMYQHWWNEVGRPRQIAMFMQGVVRHAS